MNNIKGMSEKTRALFEQFISEVQKESFAEGYEAGKSSLKSVEEKTPNQQRAELIEKAKRFVKQNHGIGGVTGRAGFYSPTSGLLCDAEFVINTEKRTIVCMLRDQITKDIYNKGIAKCIPDEVFHVEIGKAIALAKALQIDIPVEFLKAVQPSEIIIGMTVRNEKDFPQAIDGPISKGEIFKVVKDERPPSKGECQTNSVIAHSATIIDDTNAHYEVST